MVGDQVAGDGVLGDHRVEVSAGEGTAYLNRGRKRGVVRGGGSRNKRKGWSREGEGG